VKGREEGRKGGREEWKRKDKEKTRKRQEKKKEKRILVRIEARAGSKQRKGLLMSARAYLACSCTRRHSTRPMHKRQPTHEHVLRLCISNASQYQHGLRFKPPCLLAFLILAFAFCLRAGNPGSRSKALARTNDTMYKNRAMLMHLNNPMAVHANTKPLLSSSPLGQHTSMLIIYSQDDGVAHKKNKETCYRTLYRSSCQVAGIWCRISSWWPIAITT
jgi:hypothetical protein